MRRHVATVSRNARRSRRRIARERCVSRAQNLAAVLVAKFRGTKMPEKWPFSCLVTATFAKNRNAVCGLLGQRFVRVSSTANQGREVYP
jgi:hypothetical protein